MYTTKLTLVMCCSGLLCGFLMYVHFSVHLDNRSPAKDLPASHENGKRVIICKVSPFMVKFDCAVKFII